MNPEVLTVRTVRVDDPGNLLRWADALHPTVFLRGGDGIVGVGARLALAQTGENRIARLSEQWRALCAAAVIDDEVRMPGTGLVAFGSFAFIDTSATSSTLVVPRVVLGRRGDTAWLTTIDGGVPVAPTDLGDELHARLEPGAMTAEAYVSAVASATRAIGEGRARKVVLARDLVGGIPASSDRRVVLDRLATAYPDTWTFAVDGLVGASPETLVRVMGRVASARVLAGTAARGQDAAADGYAQAELVASPKDRGEHEFALRSVVAALEPHVESVTASPDPFVLELPNLLHLASDVSGTLTDASTPLDLVAALHPTAAVAGTPTDAAVDLIAELEPVDRGRYAGPVGWVSAAGDAEWAIALRCARIDDDGAVTAWAGAGIVASSVPERELAETELKFRPMREALDPAP